MSGRELTSREREALAEQLTGGAVAVRVPGVLEEVAAVLRRWVSDSAALLRGEWDPASVRAPPSVKFHWLDPRLVGTTESRPYRDRNGVLHIQVPEVGAAAEVVSDLVEAVFAEWEALGEFASEVAALAVRAVPGQTVDPDSLVTTREADELKWLALRGEAVLIGRINGIESVLRRIRARMRPDLLGWVLALLRYAEDGHAEALLVAWPGNVLEPLREPRRGARCAHPECGRGHRAR